MIHKKLACACGRHLRDGDNQQQDSDARRRRPWRHPQHDRQGGASTDGGDVQRRGHHPVVLGSSAHAEGRQREPSMRMTGHNQTEGHQDLHDWTIMVNQLAANLGSTMAARQVDFHHILPLVY